MVTDELIVRREGAAGFLTLNRPRAIHALTAVMVDAMIEALLVWRDDPSVQAVIIDHSLSPDGDPKLSRGFCSGGDIAFLRNSALTDGGVSGTKFFHDEYQLNHLLFTYAKPVVAFMDGITMGGGVGISQPARFRVATENTRLAMPETGIGLFPDVGGGWFLSRLKDRIGQFLALTGARIDGVDCLWTGLATHYLPSAALAQAKVRIADGQDIADVLASLSELPPQAKLAVHAEQIAATFASDHLEDVIAALEADGSEWALKELAVLRRKSPQTCKVALRQLVTSTELGSFADNMAMEYRLAARTINLPDFAEGVRAVIVDKDNAPQWNPATPEGVTDDLLDAIFAPLPAGEEWKPL
jgi:enoyl-CoA hydratase